MFKGNSVSRRKFIVRCHKALDGTTGAWIQKELRGIWSEHNSLKGKKDPDAWQPTQKVLIRVSIDGPSIHHNYTTADMNPVATFTQEHPHCHRLAIPRCITCPLYVKWARHIYNLATTHRTCGLVAFRTMAATTSTRQLTSDTVHGAKGSMSPVSTTGTGDTPKLIMLSRGGSGCIKDGTEYRPKSIPRPRRLCLPEYDGADR